MQDIKYQLNKRIKPPTNLKTIITAEYHDFFEVFSKDISNILRPYRKYDHKIELLKDKNLNNLGHSAFWEMSVPLAKNSNKDIRFCINYWKLNLLTQKNTYLLLLIAKTMAKLKKPNVFTKISIRQAFHKLCIAMHENKIKK